jgi:hypothetical protein
MAKIFAFVVLGIIVFAALPYLIVVGYLFTFWVIEKLKPKFKKLPYD